MIARRVLLVDDEVAILLTLKAVLEINGFTVDTATSAREAEHKLRCADYHMVITDMRMESEEAGSDVVKAARRATSNPAVAVLTAFPDESMGDSLNRADELLVKPMNVQQLVVQMEALLVAHEDKKRLAQSRPAQKRPAVKRTAKGRSAKTRSAKATAKTAKTKAVKKAPRPLAKKSAKTAANKTVKKAAKKKAKR